MFVPCSQLVVPDSREVQDVMTSLMLTHMGAGYPLRASPEHTRRLFQCVWVGIYLDFFFSFEV